MASPLLMLDGKEVVGRADAPEAARHVVVLGVPASGKSHVVRALTGDTDAKSSAWARVTLVARSFSAVSSSAPQGTPKVVFWDTPHEVDLDRLVDRKAQPLGSAPPRCDALLLVHRAVGGCRLPRDCHTSTFEWAARHGVPVLVVLTNTAASDGRDSVLELLRLLGGDGAYPSVALELMQPWHVAHLWRAVDNVLSK